MRVTSTEPGDAVAKRVAAEVRAEMARQGLSQQALADRLGWPQARVSRRIAVEGGKHQTIPFDIAELAAVAKALGVPMNQFVPAQSEVAA